MQREMKEKTFESFDLNFKKGGVAGGKKDGNFIGRELIGKLTDRYM